MNPAGADLVSLADAEMRIRQAIAAGLPGPAAHHPLAPRPRPPWTLTLGAPPVPVRPAAALVILFPRQAAAHLILTVRAAGVRHAGQVSLPGGAVDAGETIEQAALREAEEEIGLDRRRVRTVGPLTPLLVVVSGFELHPVAAICDEPPILTPAHCEVDRILEVPVARLADPRALGRMPIDRDGLRLQAPYFEVEGERIWGATAMILSELLAMLGLGVTGASLS